MKGHTKVSVVVPVFNPGANIDGLINSLDKQTLPPGEFEVVFVDDGSTDDTRARLLDVARTRPPVIVTTIANSGWPGRPRNVGTDLAHGEYVFYSDHDDEFFPEALERMYAMAKANRSDVLYGKLVRVGRPTPYWSLARSNISKADAPVALGSLTVHRLFRREFLLEHQIRFLKVGFVSRTTILWRRFSPTPRSSRYWLTTRATGGSTGLTARTRQTLR